MVVARFSLIKIGLALCLLVPLSGFVINLLYQHDLGDPTFWVSLLFGPFLVLYTVVLLREILFHRARAMWVENEQLVFVPFGWPGNFTSFLYRVPVERIASVTIDGLYTGNFTRPRGIVVDRKDRGFNRPFGQAPAQFYSEPVEVVHARLCKVLGIAPEPVTAPAEASAAADSRGSR